MKQSTLSSFWSIKSRLEGSACQKQPEEGTSVAVNQEGKGLGPLTGPEMGRRQKLGEGREGPRILLEGSPEHNLLTEAKVLKPGGSSVSGREEAGKASSGGPAGKEEGRPPDSRQGKAQEKGNGKMVGPRVGGKNPSSRATEEVERVPRVKLFPRE